MKKIIYTYLIMVFAVLLILAGCPGDLNIIKERILPAGGGKGIVSINFGAAGRTVLPENLNFPNGGIEIVFTPLEIGGPEDYREKGTIAKTLISTAALTHKLEAGKWELDVTIYRSVSDTNHIAKGKAVVDVLLNATVYANIPLAFVLLNNTTETGNFAWTITNNNNDQGVGKPASQFEIKLEALSGQADQTYSTLTSHDMTNTTGVSVTAGYYLASVRIERDLITPLDGAIGTPGANTRAAGAVRAVWDEIIHVYPGQTTHIKPTFGATDYFNGIENMWFIGLGQMLGQNLPGEKNNDGTFSWTLTREGDTYFRFGLTDPAMGINNTGAFYGTSNSWSSTTVTIDYNNMAIVFYPFRTAIYDNFAYSWILSDTGTFVGTFNPAARSFIVTKPVNVTGVTVNDGPAAIVQGNTGTFKADLEGTNKPVNPSFTWSIESPAVALNGTSINQAGVLTVGEFEPNTSLTIKAAYGTHSATRTVNITPSSVSGVTVTSSSGLVLLNGTMQFTAQLTGTNLPATPTITWTVESSSIAVAAGTTISPAGLLSVASNQAVGVLTVKAAYKTVSGTKNVEVTSSLPIQSITVHGPPEVQKEKDKSVSASFTTTIVDTNTAPVTPTSNVVWTIQSPAVPLAAGTGIVNAGYGGGTLTIAKEENNTSLAIRAEYGGKSDVLNVKITPADDGVKPTFTDPSQITVESTGGGQITIVEGGYGFQFGTQGEWNVVAKFTVNLGAGKTLNDFSHVSFNLKLISGGPVYTIWVRAGNPLVGNYNYVINTNGESLYVNGVGESKFFEIPIQKHLSWGDGFPTTGSSIEVAILPLVSNQNASATRIEVTNIYFKPKE